MKPSRKILRYSFCKSNQSIPIPELLKKNRVALCTSVKKAQKHYKYSRNLSKKLVHIRNMVTEQILQKYTPHLPSCSFTLASLIVANLIIQNVHSHQRQTQILKTHSSKTILTEMIIRFHCFKIFADF